LYTGQNVTPYFSYMGIDKLLDLANISSFYPLIIRYDVGKAHHPL